MWVYPMRSTADLVSFFENFIRMVEQQTGNKVKFLRSDNGAQYTSKGIKKLLDDHGIEAELTAPHTSARNGRAERIQGVLLGMVRKLLANTTLPKSMWPALVRTAAYLHNIIPTKSSLVTDPERPIPSRMSAGQEPSLWRRIFGQLDA